VEHRLIKKDRNGGEIK
jgi:hypothetical protein